MLKAGKEKGRSVKKASPPKEHLTILQKLVKTGRPERLYFQTEKTQLSVRILYPTKLLKFFVSLTKLFLIGIYDY